MSIEYSPCFDYVSFDNDGKLNVGGTVEWFYEGTAVPATAFNESDQPLAQPYVIGSDGRVNFKLTSNFAYRIVIKDSLGLTVLDRDGVKANVEDSESFFKVATTSADAFPSFLQDKVKGGNKIDASVVTTSAESYVEISLQQLEISDVNNLQSSLDVLSSATSANASDIDSNTSAINVNSSDISANTSAINVNTSAISDNASNIATNASDIATNTAAINVNTSAIADNASDISTNASNIATNTSNISSNTSAINVNTSAISDNANDIATNTSNISTNTSNISTNTSNIAANTSAININTSAIADNASDISTNASNISTNTSNIATNTSAIAANTSAINVNASNISANTSAINVNASDIATNASNISANTSAINVNTSAINVNASAISANTSAINVNASDILTNASNIATNTSAIADNASDIATNTSAIAVNTSAIADNASDIASNTSLINTNTSAIADNANDIATNASNISSNTSLINANTSAINVNTSAISDNASDIATNTSNIATNTSNISTNAGNIATNTSNIAANTSAINVNTSAIADNTSDIATNTSNIATNASNIATNTSAINVNTSAIADNTSDIATNTSNISSNTSAIAVNTSAIAANTSAIDAKPDELNELTDVTITNVQEGESLIYNGTEWINNNPSVYIQINNGQGSAITRGQPVYVSGTTGGGTPIVSLADNDGAGTNPAIGLVADNSIANGDDGRVLISGILEHLNTSAYSVGEALYLDDVVGDLTNVRPSGSSEQVQKVGLVTKVDATSGKILVIGAGRANDVPNELTTLTGVSLDATDLGTFTGSVIANNQNIKEAFQDTEDAIEVNKTDIATNTSDIATNASNIATNTSDIATNTGNIATNTSNISTNTSNISTNTSNISTNTSNISTNTSNIATNTSDIATNTSNISTNTSAINVNATDIAANTAAISGIANGLDYQGTWNASTNTPTLVSGTGTEGHYYIVATAGTTNLDGITDWNVGDWVLWSESAGAWQQVDNTSFESVTNQGTGAEIFKQVLNGTEVQLRSLVDGSIISLTQNTNDITIDDSNVVSLNGTQTITGNKTFDGSSTFNSSLTVNSTSPFYVKNNRIRFDTSGTEYGWIGTNGTTDVRIDVSNGGELLTNYTPSSSAGITNKAYVDGEISALASDYVTIDTTQTITGAKIFDNDVDINGVLNLASTSNGSAADGDIWYDSATGKMQSKEDGIEFNLSGTYEVSSDTDLNNYTKHGSTLTPSTALTNAPAGFATSGRRLVQVNQYGLDQTAYIAQTLYSMGDNKVAWRVYNATAWGEWHEVPYMVDDVLKLASTTNSAATNGDIWYDGTDLNIQGQVNLSAPSGATLGFYWTKNSSNQWGMIDDASSDDFRFFKYVGGVQEIFRIDDSTSVVTHFTDNNFNGVVNLASTTNASPTTGDIWSDGTKINIEGGLKVKKGNSSTPAFDILNSSDASVVALYADADGDGQLIVNNSALGQILNVDSDANNGYHMLLNGVYRLGSTTAPASPTNGDIYNDSTAGELMAVDAGNDKHTLSLGLGYLNGSVDTISDGDTQTYTKFFRTPASWTGSPYAGTNGDNQGYLLNLLAGSSLYGTQLFLGQDGWNQGEAKVRCLNNGTWGDWQNIFISKDGANGVLPLRTATNSSPTNGDVWYDGSAINAQSSLNVDGNVTVNGPKVIIDAPFANSRGLDLRTAGVQDWLLYQAGSSNDLRLVRYNTSGVFQGNVFTIDRSTGDTTFNHNLNLGDNISLTRGSSTTISRGDSTGFLSIYGDAANTGAGLLMYGSTHATNSDQGRLRIDTNTKLLWGNDSVDVQAIDFTVDTDTLFVDASTDRVGINTSTPDEALTVVGNISASGDINVGDVLNLASTTNGSSTNGDIWYDGTTGKMQSKEDGVTFNLSGTYEVSSDTDLNNYTKHGSILTPSTALTNAPAGFSTSGRRLLQVNQYGLNQTAYMVQTLYSMADNKVAWRVYNVSTWSEWHEVPYMVDDVLKLQSTTNASPVNGDVWYDGTEVNIRGVVNLNSQKLLATNFVDLVDTTGWGVRVDGSNDSFRPLVTNDTELGLDIRRWSKLWSTDGDFSGTVDVGGLLTANNGLEVNTNASDFNAPINSNARLNVADSQADFLVSSNSYGTMYANSGDSSLTIQADSTNATGGLKLTSSNGVTSSSLTVNGDFTVNAGNINFSGLPTSSAGLSAGDLWNDSGTLKIV